MLCTAETNCGALAPAICVIKSWSPALVTTTVNVTDAVVVLPAASVAVDATVFAPTRKSVAAPVMLAHVVVTTPTASVAVSGHSVVFVGGMRCDFSVEQALALGPHHPTRPVCDANANSDIVTIDGARSAVSTFPLFSGHAYHASTVLADGRIYIPGGLVSPGRPTITAETIALTRR